MSNAIYHFICAFTSKTLPEPLHPSCTLFYWCWPFCAKFLFITKFKWHRRFLPILLLCFNGNAFRLWPLCTRKRLHISAKWRTKKGQYLSILLANLWTANVIERNFVVCMYSVSTRCECMQQTAQLKWALSISAAY